MQRPYSGVTPDGLSDYLSHAFNRMAADMGHVESLLGRFLRDVESPLSETDLGTIKAIQNRATEANNFARVVLTNVADKPPQPKPIPSP